MRDTVSSDDLHLVLLHILEKLRSTGGANLAGLQAVGGGLAAPLLELAAVRRYSAVHEVVPESSALAVIEECAQELSASDNVVVDAALGLGLLGERYARSGVSRRAIRQLSDRQLSKRRRALLENWLKLHEALTDAVEAPSVGSTPTERDLRSSIEPAALKMLVRQLVLRDRYSVGSSNTPPATEVNEQVAPGRKRGRIVVVGAAVMDAVFRIRELPRWETSSEAHDFVFKPGGKGLTQAVAAARLGHRVSLVAAIADDRFGTEIINYLRANNVGTQLLKIVPGADTPFTGVLEMDLGDSLAAYWRNEKEVRLDPWDCDEIASELLASDAVLMTFEVPRETVEHALTLVRDPNGRRPATIVAAAQPYPDTTLSPDVLKHIDYVVVHPWELRRLSSTGAQQFDPDPVARELMETGAGAVCLLLRGGCTMYSQSAHDVVQSPVFATIYKESAAARDAFCAGLADELIQSGERFSANAADWASAAMSCTIADYPLSNPLPAPERIAGMLARFRSRQ